MIERVVINMVITFILRQLEKFQKTIDWAKVKADLDERIAALIPGTWWDSDAITAVNLVLDAAACALHQTTAIDEILHDLADQKWSEAGLRLKQLILDVWAAGHCPTSQKAKALVNAHLSEAVAAA